MPRSMRMSAAVIMMMSARQQPGAGDVDRKTQCRNRDRLVERDGNGVDKARDRLISDQERDHRQDDGAGISRKIAEFSGSERETAIAGVFAGIGIGERGKQQRSGMGGHVQAVSDQRER